MKLYTEVSKGCKGSIIMLINNAPCRNNYVDVISGETVSAFVVLVGSECHGNPFPPLRFLFSVKASGLPPLSIRYSSCDHTIFLLLPSFSGYIPLQSSDDDSIAVHVLDCTYQTVCDIQTAVRHQYCPLLYS